MPTEETLNWGDLANTRVGEIEPPKNIPNGHYSAVITGQGKTDNVGQNKTLVIVFPVRLNEAMDDVDQEAFAASDGFRPKGYEISFYLTSQSLYRFAEFGKGMGASNDMNVQELAEYLATCGEEFVVEVSEQTGRRGGKFLQLDNPVPMSTYLENA